MLHLQTTSKTYWTRDFEISSDDLEFIYNVFLEEETPLTTPDLIQRLIEYRIENEFRQLKKFQATGEFFQPAKSYEIGQELIFPAFDFAKGKVRGIRAGQNPIYGEFKVLDVLMADQSERLLACDFAPDHKLNQDYGSILQIERPSAAEIYNRHKRSLTPTVVDALREDADTLFIAKRWFLKSLLLDINMGHLNLAEAVLDMESGGPIATQSIAQIIEVPQQNNPILQSYSLDYSLSLDERFDEVGPAGRVLWFLKRMEPAEILSIPAPLQYTEIPYDPSWLTEDLLDLEDQIDDELSMLELDEDEDLDEEGQIILTYPHLRAGTLPLAPRIEHLFPIAYRTPRILITLVDGQTKTEMRGWVVRDHNYVYGLGDFYRQNDVPIGARLYLKPDPNDPSRVIIDLKRRRPRNEWVWTASVDQDQLLFKEVQTPIAAEFDELMLLGVSKPEELAKIAQRYQRPDQFLRLIQDVLRQLASLSAQKHVHSKTLYSAVNLIKRCPPAPIFAALQADPSFVRTGGLYWQIA